MKRYTLYITISLALLATGNVAWSQDIIDHTPLRNEGDAVDWDKISLPPSDPYTLMYKPPRPEGAMNITDEASCLAANGKWLDKMRYNQDFDLYGCSIDHVFEGRWQFVWRKHMPSNASASNKKKGAKVEPAVTSIPDEALGGYLWFIEGKEEGEAVQFEEDAKFITFLQTYHDGEFDGPVMKWNKLGQLTYFIHYENGKREGQTASFTTAGTPEYFGNYTDDQPSGDWYVFNPFFGSLQFIKRYDKPVPEEYTSVLDKNERLVWVEEFDFMAGKKIKDGYRNELLSDDPSDASEMIHLQHFYDTNGGQWIDVHFAHGEILDDEKISALCSPYKEYSFNHATRTIICLDDESEEVIDIQYYPTNEIRMIEKRVMDKELDLEDPSATYWLREEFHKDGSPLTSPSSIPVIKFDMFGKYYVPEEPYDFVYSKTEQEQDQTKQQTTIAKNLVVNGSGVFTDYWSNGNVRSKGGFLDIERSANGLITPRMAGCTVGKI